MLGAIRDFSANKFAKLRFQKAKLLEKNLTTELNKATEENNIPYIKALLKGGADPLHYFYFSSYPVDIAIENGNLKILEILLENRRLNYEDKNYLLRYAAYKHKPEIVEYFLEREANPNAIDRITEETALLSATNIYFDRGDDGRERQPTEEEQEDIIQTIRLLLKAGANVNLRSNEYQLLPLERVTYGHDLPGITKLLLGEDSDPDSIKNRTRALRWAVKFGAIENIKLLIKHGADVFDEKINNVLGNSRLSEDNINNIRDLIEEERQKDRDLIDSFRNGSKEQKKKQ